MPKFIVETLNTFHEVHVIEAESAEQAQEIAKHSDYNASIWLGTTFLEVNDYSEERIANWKKRDSYFFDGYAQVDDDGLLEYRRPDGSFNGNMPTMKIFEKSAEKVLDKQK
jgi:hypothetical protein